MTEELENKKLEWRAKEWLVKDKGGSIIQSLVNLIKEFTELREKRISELEKENEKLMQMLASSADCETCKHYDEDLEKEDKEPCKNCFYDNSFWELKED